MSARSALWRWQRGRREGGYHKLLLAQARRADLYLLRFPIGSFIGPHRDPVDGAGHLRINLVLVPARRGGQFMCEGAMVDRPRLKVFRPDRCTHSVSPIEAGTRWVLSLGVATRA